MEELKLIVELLGNVSHHALIGALVYMVLDFIKTPAIIAISGYCLNVLVKNIKIKVNK